MAEVPRWGIATDPQTSRTCRPLAPAPPSPASVAAVRVSLEIIRDEPQRRERLQVAAERLRSELCALGFAVMPGLSPIVAAVKKNELDVFRLSGSLLDQGIYVNPVLRPAASYNMLRISCTTAHTDGQVDQLVETLRRTSKRLGISTEAEC